MSRLVALRGCSSLNDLAAILDYKPSALSFILYKIPAELRYRQFEIPKRAGGTRLILAPNEKLKLLQQKLAAILSDCQDEILGMLPKRPSLAHGFRRRHSIVSNAVIHRNRKNVLNVDIDNFFPSFNFGRVLGFFGKSRDFQLQPAVATLLAQIACHRNQLPQGSPCSPIIANLIFHTVDIQLLRLAREHRSFYSRYADDLTFSTDLAQFSEALAVRSGGPGQDWVAGDTLQKIIKFQGFGINEKKTRMQHRRSRQIVTGIIVNRDVNVRREYLKNARASCDQLFKSGKFFLKDAATQGRITQLQGILAHIDAVRMRRRNVITTEKNAKLRGFSKLYSEFTFFRLFYALTSPIVICEGKTDAIYLKCAIERFGDKFVRLSGGADPAATKIKFFNYSKRHNSFLNLDGGAGDISNFIGRYRSTSTRFKCPGQKFPVIVLVDNDDGALSAFSTIKKVTNGTSIIPRDQNFYFITENLYLVATPLLGSEQSTIEDLFDEETLKTELNGKTFQRHDKGNSFDPKRHYGKRIFAERVVRPKCKSVDFSKFTVLLDRLSMVVEDYENRNR